MKTVTMIEAKTNFGQLLEGIQQEPILVTKKDHPVAVILSMQDIKNISWVETANRSDNDLTDLQTYKGSITSFSDLDAVKWQRKIRAEWNRDWDI